MSLTTRKVLTDTNVVIRALTGNPPEQAEKVRSALKEADDGALEIIMPSFIVAEAIFVLESFPELTRQQIANAVRGFCTLPGIVLEEQSAVITALSQYEENNVDFADAYLAARAAETGYEVFSFDKDFRKLGVQIFTP